MDSSDEIKRLQDSLAEPSRVVYRGIVESRDIDVIVQKKIVKIRRNMRITQIWVTKASNDAKDAKEVSAVAAATAKSAVQAVLVQSDEIDPDLVITDEMAEEENNEDFEEEAETDETSDVEDE